MSSMLRVSPRSQRGLSLIELIIAVTIFISMILASGVLYNIMLKIFVKDKLTQDLGRESDAILAHMSRNLKEATTVVLSVPSPVTFTVTTPSGARTYYVDVNTNQLHYISELGVDENLMQPNTRVTTLTFTPTSTLLTLETVQVNLTMNRAKGNTTVNLTVGSSIDTRPQ